MNKQKAYKIIGNKRNMTHEEWLVLRKKSIGGSEIASVIGVSRWNTPFIVWAEKTGRIERNTNNAEAMYWGSTLEPILRTEFAKRTGFVVKEVNSIFASVQHEFLTANIDGYVELPTGEHAILEIKTAGIYAENDWADGLPVEYFIQVQHYLYVTGLHKAFVAVLIGGNQFKYIEVERDDEVINTIVGLAVQFWNDHMVTDMPPDVNGKDSSILTNLYPISKSSTVHFNQDMQEVFEQYEAAKLLIEQGKYAKEEAEAKIKAAMQDNDTALCTAWKVTWKSSSRTNLNIDKVKAVLTEDQYNNCITTTETRTLRISKIKGGK